MVLKRIEHGSYSRSWWFYRLPCLEDMIHPVGMVLGYIPANSHRGA